MERVITYDGDGNPIYKEEPSPLEKPNKEAVRNAKIQRALSFYRLFLRALEENGVIVLPTVRYYKMQQLEDDLMRNFKENM